MYGEVTWLNLSRKKRAFLNKMCFFHFKKHTICFWSLLAVLFFTLLNVYELSKRDYAVQRLEYHVSKILRLNIRKHTAEQSDQGNADYFNDDDMIIIYNRVPKTGSTSFAGIAYDLCYKNKFHVLHVNTTKNVHTLSIPDQMHLIQNITDWNDVKPALYHGHFYYVDFPRLGLSCQRPVYINLVRKPLDRLLSYYYFVRYGDNFRPYLKRRKQGNQMTFDECVARNHKDCDPVNLWLQIPFFCGHSYRCRQPGSRWALEQAKYNLANNYLLVGVTEELGDFIAMLEIILPRFFKGAMEIYLNGSKSHLRQTNKKETPSEITIAKIQESHMWKLENEFYEFALEQFNFQKKLTFDLIDQFNATNISSLSNMHNKHIYMLSDGRLYVAKGLQFHYEKVRPR